MSEAGSGAVADANTYRSAVVAPAQIALGVLSGLVAGAILLAFGSGWLPVAVLALLVATGLGVYLAVVSLQVEPGRVTFAQGRGEREQRIVYASELLSAHARTLTWAQCFGVGMPAAERSTRLSVRPGPALVLLTRDDESIVVSTPDAQRALALLTGGEPVPARPAAPAPTAPAPPTPIPPTPRRVTPPAPPSRSARPAPSPRPRPRSRTQDEG